MRRLTRLLVASVATGALLLVPASAASAAPVPVKPNKPDLVDQAGPQARGDVTAFDKAEAAGCAYWRRVNARTVDVINRCGTTIAIMFETSAGDSSCFAQRPGVVRYTSRYRIHDVDPC